MKIVSGQKQENCFDGDFVYIYTFDAEWTKEKIMALGASGNLQYYGSFPKPMFNVRFSGGTTMKGVEGTKECRVIFTRDEPQKAKKLFEETFSKEKE